ncbi:branched-chain-amino-acid aminotransferase-like protein 2 [Acanthaster planci]|uniref:Branched-chain-amino-acid aminotransferase-like protein 2 n=1 Tax=Acanthaster planci TaxID=133434 RepID=A0A8B7ZX19_ACAPL|nr:branched-chain-amino-acid aminotransferase-like protein 2 [Acanthaster planci]XP_022108085.1 branched-chain-amino-acid aminotransferase-like protein 2 [Acanthaster planci]XP_022108086.1 branched-chain-amino-acid aminotransferase-like protein 2 [Acanthaster planci]
MSGNHHKHAGASQVRLLVWAVPRSLSTVLTKCLSFVEDSLVIFEPYFCAYLLGPQRFVPEVLDAVEEVGLANYEKEAAELTSVKGGFEASECTYEWAREQLEADHVGKRFVFCKDIASAVIIGDKLEFLPRDYRHVFLIRHPLRVFPSMKEMIRLTERASHDFSLDEVKRFPTYSMFRDASDLSDHIRKEQKQEAIIIDADDLQQDPRGVLSALFTAIGMPFQERLLNWEAGDAVSRSWFISTTQLRGNQIGQYYKNAFASTCFLRPSALPDRESLSADILRCVDASMPYYKKMYAQRLKPC